MTWLFADGSSCSTLGSLIDHVVVSIPGVTLPNGGSYPCQANGVQGALFTRFPFGSYSATVTAVGSSGTIYYRGTRSFQVQGDTQVQVNLDRTTAGQPGDVTFLWYFNDGTTCAQHPEIANLVINIPGEQLANGGVVPCSSGSPAVQGYVFQNFVPGGYTFTIDAVDAQGYASWHAQGSFTINGNTTVSVSLAPVSPGDTATLQLRWTFGDAFGGRLSCAQAGVETVDVDFGGTQFNGIPCSANGVDGADFANVQVGTYEIALTANDSTDPNLTPPLYRFDQQVVVSGPNTRADVVLEPQYGQWTLFYDFANAGSCAAAGVSSVSLAIFNASDPNDTTDYSGTNGALYPCQDAPNNAFLYDHFPGGSWIVEMRGYDDVGQLRGIDAQTTVLNGAANDTSVTLQTCGTAGSGC